MSTDASKHRFWIGAAIASIGCVGLSGLCFFGAFAFGVVKGVRQATTPVTPDAAVDYRVLSGDELVAYGDALEARVLAGDWTGVDAQMDWPALERRTVVAMHRPNAGALAAGGITGMEHQGMSAIFHGGHPAQSRFSFRGVFARDGQERLRFRRLEASGGFQFQEFLVGMRPGAEAQVVDVWSLTTGEDLSETLAEGLGGIRDANPDLLRRLDGQRNPWTEHGEELDRAQALLAQGDTEQALELMEALPPAMRDSRIVSLLRVRAASAGDRTRYAAVLDDVAAHHPDDPAVLVMLIDRYAIAEQWANVAHTLQRVQEVVSDPYLDVMRARMEYLAGQAPAARARIDAAVLAEPTLLDAHDVRMVIALGQGDMATADHELMTLVQQFRVDPEVLARMDGYADIRTLPSYP